MLTHFRLIGRNNFLDHFFLNNDLFDWLIIVESLQFIQLLILYGSLFHLCNLALSSLLFSVYVLILKFLQVALSLLLLISFLSLFSIYGFDLVDKLSDLVLFLLVLQSSSLLEAAGTICVQFQFSLFCSVIASSAYATVSRYLLDWRHEEHDHVCKSSKNYANAAADANAVLCFRIWHKVGKSHQVVHDDDQFPFVENVHPAVIIRDASVYVPSCDDDEDAEHVESKHLQPQVRACVHDYCA